MPIINNNKITNNFSPQSCGEGMHKFGYPSLTIRKHGFTDQRSAATIENLAVY